MLRASDCNIVVAGGSGIAVAFPLIWALLEGDTDIAASRQTQLAVEDGKPNSQPQRRTVHLLWVIHSRSHRSWIPEQQLEDLVALGLDLLIPEPTAEAGRPDVQGLVRDWIDGAATQGCASSVIASGPDGLNRAVRNACAGAIGQGLDVRVAVEKFGW